jgi:hypothetical protein
MPSCGFFGNSVLWQRSLANTPTPERFSILMFPKHNRVRLLDEKGKETNFYLSRALVATQAEINEKVIGVNFDDARYHVQLDELTPKPTSKQDELITNWKTERSKRGEKVEITYLELKDGKLQAILTVNSPKDIETFTYTVEDDTVFPEKWEMDRARHLAK